MFVRREREGGRVEFSKDERLNEVHVGLAKYQKDTVFVSGTRRQG